MFFRIQIERITRNEIKLPAGESNVFFCAHFFLFLFFFRVCEWGGRLSHFVHSFAVRSLTVTNLQINNTIRAPLVGIQMSARHNIPYIESFKMRSRTQTTARFFLISSFVCFFCSFIFISSSICFVSVVIVMLSRIILLATFASFLRVRTQASSFRRWHFYLFHSVLWDAWIANTSSSSMM